jgi:hypothetical protein
MTDMPDYPLEPPPEDYDYEPEPFLSGPAPGQPALPGFDPPPAEPPREWSWLEARFVGLEQLDQAGYGNRECKTIRSAPSGAVNSEGEPWAAAIECSAG